MITARAPKQHLQAQLRYLTSSCEAYDKGDKEEAIRIAGVLRTMFHDRGTNISVLTHVMNETKSSVRVLSSIRPLGPEVIQGGGLSWTVYTGGLGVEPTAISEPLFLNDFRKVRRWLMVGDWWNEEIYRTFGQPGTSVTRAELCKIAADKDGAAHVDSKLPEKYLRLHKPQMGMVINGVNIGFPQTNQHFADLRQLGFEVLSSRDILDLAG
ncbi:MAG TPA: hypothetical protein VGM81_22245 [Burkholderiaceae bacterium]|jgi:hypothetical protein